MLLLFRPGGGIGRHAPKKRDGTRPAEVGINKIPAEALAGWLSDPGQKNFPARVVELVNTSRQSGMPSRPAGVVINKKLSCPGGGAPKKRDGFTTSRGRD